MKTSQSNGQLTGTKKKGTVSFNQNESFTEVADFNHAATKSNEGIRSKKKSSLYEPKSLVERIELIPGDNNFPAAPCCISGHHDVCDRKIRLMEVLNTVLQHTIDTKENSSSKNNIIIDLPIRKREITCRASKEEKHMGDLNVTAEFVDINSDAIEDWIQQSLNLGSQFERISQANKQPPYVSQGTQSSQQMGRKTQPVSWQNVDQITGFDSLRAPTIAGELIQPKEPSRRVKLSKQDKQFSKLSAPDKLLSKNDEQKALENQDNDTSLNVERMRREQVFRF